MSYNEFDEGLSEVAPEEVAPEQWVVLNGRVAESSQQIGMLRKTIQELISSMDVERTLSAAVQQAVRDIIIDMNERFEELSGKMASETNTRSDDVRGLRDALRAETAARLELTAIEEGFWSTAQDRSTRLEDRAAKMEDLLHDSLERCSVELSREKEVREQLAMELHESLGRTLALSGQVYDLRTAHEGRLDQKNESRDALQEHLLALEKNHKQDMDSLKADLELCKAQWAVEIGLRMRFVEDSHSDERPEKSEQTEKIDRNTHKAATHEAVSLAPATLRTSALNCGSRSRAASVEILPRDLQSFQQEPRAGAGVTSATARASSQAVLSPPAPGPVSVSPSPTWFIKPCSRSKATSRSPLVATVPRPLRSTCSPSLQQRCSGHGARRCSVGGSISSAALVSGG